MASTLNTLCRCEEALQSPVFAHVVVLIVAFRKYAELSAAKDKELQATGLQTR